MLRRGSVLIVDSKPAIADLLVDILTDAGYDALSACDPPSAFWMTITHAPALILLDMHLRDTTCFEIIPYLQKSAVVTTPIVLMSTRPADVDLQVPGVDTFLVKPFDIDEMLACVASYAQPIAARAASISIDMRGRGSVSETI